MAVTPDGRFIVTGHGNGEVLLWSWDEHAQAWPRQVLLRHAGPVRGLAFAADGRTLVSVGRDGRLFVTLPVDSGRWQKRTEQMPVQRQQASVPRGVLSPNGRWVVWAGTAASNPATFTLDLSGLSSVQVPQLTVAHAADNHPVVDGAELPAEMGESIVGDPVFSTDGSRVAVQVGERLLFWDLSAAAPLDAAVALPPGTRLIGAAPDGAGWIAGTDSKADGHFFFDTNLSNWVTVSCRLAGRTLTVEEWRRYVGNERPYAPPCGG